MLFPSAVGDLDLFTDEEVATLTHLGVLKSPISGTSNPHVSSPASRVEPGSSTRKRGYGGSPSHRHPVSAAAGSCEDLGKLEHECEATCNQLHQEIGTECTHTMSGDSTHGCITRDGRSVTLKCGRSVDTGISGECPHPKERWAERGRSIEHRCKDSPEHPPPPQFLFTPAAPSCPITGSLHTPFLDSTKDRGVGAEVPVSSTGLVTPSSACQPVQSSGQLTTMQVDSIFVTSGLTAEQYEEIFLLSPRCKLCVGS